MSEIIFAQESREPKMDATEIICIIDRSGSMDSIKTDVIGGFNGFLRSQKEVPGNAFLTLAQFDDEYQIVYDYLNIHEVQDYDSDTYVPRGLTALYDAIGKTLTTISNRRDSKNPEDVPKRVMVAIMTDGEENSSKYYSLSKIKSMIEERTRIGWEFLFLTVGLDKFKSNSIGSNIGIQPNRVFAVEHNTRGMNALYGSVNSFASSYRTSGGDWLQDEQNKLKLKKIIEDTILEQKRPKVRSYKRVMKKNKGY